MELLCLWTHNTSSGQFKIIKNRTLDWNLLIYIRTYFPLHEILHYVSRGSLHISYSAFFFFSLKGERKTAAYISIEEIYCTTYKTVTKSGLNYLCMERVCLSCLFAWKGSVCLSCAWPRSSLLLFIESDLWLWKKPNLRRVCLEIFFFFLPKWTDRFGSNQTTSWINPSHIFTFTFEIWSKIAFS